MTIMFLLWLTIESKSHSVMSDFDKCCPIKSLYVTCWTVIHEILQARILECVARSLLQGTFSIQGLSPGLPHCRQILYQLSHKGLLGNDYYNSVDLAY